MPSNEFLSPATVAQKLSVSVTTLRTWREAGTGPKFIRLGKVIRYRQEDLADWIVGASFGGAQ